jgi:hypothetical protein
VRGTFPWVAVVALVAWAVIQGRDRSEDVDRALAAEATVATLRPLADALQTENAARAVAYTADSARWAGERAEARAREAAAIDRARLATIRASAVATDLTARLDSTETALFAAYQAEVDSVVAGKDAVIASLGGRVSTLEDERTALLGVVGGLRSEVEVLGAIGTQLEAATEALHAALRAQGRRAWYERGAVAAAAVGVLLLR